MKIQLFIGILLLSSFSLAQEPSIEELLSNVAIRPPPATFCSDVEIPPNGACFDFPPAIPIVEAIREVLGEDVYVNMASFNNPEIYTDDVGLTADEIRQRIDSTTLPDGRRLLDIITIIEGDFF